MIDHYWPNWEEITPEIYTKLDIWNKGICRVSLMDGLPDVDGWLWSTAAFCILKGRPI